MDPFCVEFKRVTRREYTPLQYDVKNPGDIDKLHAQLWNMANIYTNVSSLLLLHPKHRPFIDYVPLYRGRIAPFRMLLHEVLLWVPSPCAVPVVERLIENFWVDPFFFVLPRLKKTLSTYPCIKAAFAKRIDKEVDIDAIIDGDVAATWRLMEIVWNRTLSEGKKRRIELMSTLRFHVALYCERPIDGLKPKEGTGEVTTSPVSLCHSWGITIGDLLALSPKRKNPRYDEYVLTYISKQIPVRRENFSLARAISNKKFRFAAFLILGLNYTLEGDEEEEESDDESDYEDEEEDDEIFHIQEIPTGQEAKQGATVVREIKQEVVKQEVVKQDPIVQEVVKAQEVKQEPIVQEVSREEVRRREHAFFTDIIKQQLEFAERVKSAGQTITELVKGKDIEVICDDKECFLASIEDPPSFPKEVPPELRKEVECFLHPALSRVVSLGLLPHYSQDPNIRALHEGVFCSFLSKGVYDPRILIEIADFTRLPTAFLDSKLSDGV